MSYIDENYYQETYKGEAVDSADFPGLLGRAEEIVEEMCMYRISEGRLAEFSPEVQERVKKAVCAQIEYLDANGGSDLDNGADLQSVGLGKFSYTGGSGSAGGTQSSYSPRARRILAPTGLLYRGGGCL
nr:hypothetical protein [uncultured Sellimonas sp.]